MANASYKIKRKKTRRGLNKNKHKSNSCLNNFNDKNTKFSIIGTNANCLSTKKESLFSLINFFKPSAILIQETMMRTIGQIDLTGYTTFEKLRINKNGGGFLTAVLNDMSSVLISMGEDNNEIITVQVNLSGKKCRIINAYGPQEQTEINNLECMKFWINLEGEISNALDDGCMVLLEMDANAKVGQIIRNNPQNNISNNGKLLLEMIERCGLTIVNSMDKCKGRITRERIF